MMKNERHECLINKDSELGMQKYMIKDDIQRKKVVTTISIDKNLHWDQIVDNDKKMSSQMDTYDQ